MKKIPTRRHQISIDMSAMSDVVFIILAFFMMSSQIKLFELDNIALPSSHNNNVCKAFIFCDRSLRIRIDKYRNVLFEFSNDFNKNALINEIEHYQKINLNSEEKVKFLTTFTFDYPVTNIKIILNDSEKSYYRINLSDKNIRHTLSDWITIAQKNQPYLRIEIVGDSRLNFTDISNVINVVQSKGINLFKLVTEYEE